MRRKTETEVANTVVVGAEEADTGVAEAEKADTEGTEVADDEVTETQVEDTGVAGEEPPSPPRAETSYKRLGSGALGAILLAEGYSSLSVEILGLRRLVPHVGSTVLVTSIVLAAYLAALAIGYERGGKLAAAGGNLRSMLGARLAIAACLAAFWLSDFGIALVFDVPQAIVGGQGWEFPGLLSTVLYSVLGIAPIGWLLAESILLAYGCAKPKNPSERAGNVFALSTVGNVAGSLLTAFVILSFFGTSAAMIIIVVCLLIAAAIAAPKAPVFTTSVSVTFILVFVSVVLYGQLDYDGEFLHRNVYGDYKVIEYPEESTADSSRALSMNGSHMSRDDPEGRGFDYVELIEDDICTAESRTVLVLGAAGRTLGRGRDCSADITFVDIDPYQREIADEFLYGDPPGGLTIKDGRVFLQTTDKRWDFIVFDVFSYRGDAPTHMLSHEFFTIARERLNDDGVFFANIIVLNNEMRFRTRIDRTIRSVFAYCDARPGPLKYRSSWMAKVESDSTFIYRCPRSSLDGDRTIYTDDLGRADFDTGVR
ncbi:MAG: fused MFS/spermidine synthase [Acidimicrobiaceae bacterium]|nr:fused MFS/spermidine synthase [Acidimicrobiaceae bacterium]